MNEDFLYYIWQYQLFKKENLKTTQGSPIQLLKIGLKNDHSGPDFSGGKIKIGDIDWVGNVEIHTKASDWYLHKHHTDTAYNSVILHVVWEADKEVLNQKNETVPCLELRFITPKIHFEKYQNLINGGSKIPCDAQLAAVDNVNIFNTLDTALTYRLERKSTEILQRLEKNKGDWEETLYQLMLTHFGFKLNNQAFETLAERLPRKILSKYAENIFQLEALLFGTAGLINPADIYGKELSQEFEYLAQKYKLQNSVMQPIEWKFMRTRPANFPTVRIAQAAAMLKHSPLLFETILGHQHINELFAMFKSEVSAYWQSHVVFGKSSTTKSKLMGRDSINNLIINVVVPTLTAYSFYIGNMLYKEKAILLLEHLAAEENRITKMWKELGIKASNMFDSQAQIELYNEFCIKKRCLECSIGMKLLQA